MFVESKHFKQSNWINKLIIDLLGCIGDVVSNVCGRLLEKKEKVKVFKLYLFYPDNISLIAYAKLKSR